MFLNLFPRNDNGYFVTHVLLNVSLKFSFRSLVVISQWLLSVKMTQFEKLSGLLTPWEWWPSMHWQLGRQWYNFEHSPGQHLFACDSACVIISYNINDYIELVYVVKQGAISRTIYPSYLKFDGKSVYCNSVVGYHNATKRCTCHNSTAIVPCARFHSDHLSKNLMRVEWNFHRIWITMEKSFVKWTPVHQWPVNLLGIVSGVVRFTDHSMMTSSNGNIYRVTGPLCGEFTGPGEFPAQKPVTRSFDVFFDLRPNKRLSKQPWGWWFETLSWSLWRHCNGSGHNDLSLDSNSHIHIITCKNPLHHYIPIYCIVHMVSSISIWF